MQQQINRAPLHQVHSDQTGEVKRTMHRFLSCLRHAKNEVGDQGYNYLNANGVFRNADKVFYSQCLLDPAKEQLDFPACVRISSPTGE
jgi:hypothetical protein